VPEDRAGATSLAIFILNLFLGWTGIGSVDALIWAVLKERTIENST
jgi:hypothetical protein